jgi:nucleoside-diphosphate-sugar epimerase
MVAGHGRAIFLTGATGLVGSELLRRYAAQGDRVYALMRAPSATALEERCTAVLADLGLDPGEAPTITPVRGDVTRPDLGLEPGLREQLAREVTDVIHCATDIHFGRPLGESRAVNLLGVVNLMDLVRRWSRVERVAHVSTAHVAGRRTGVIYEDELVHTAGFVNAYEQSKYEAEVYLRGLMDDLPIAVYRSSTLIGNAATGRVRQFNFMHQTVRLCLNNLVPVLPGDPHGPVDLIAADWLADALVYLIDAAFTPGRTYHLVAGRDHALTFGELINLTIECLEVSPHRRRDGELRVPEIVDLATFEALIEAGAADGTREAQVLGALSHFIPHMALPKAFDRRHARAALAGSGVELPAIRCYYPRIVDYCLRTRWGRLELDGTGGHDGRR